MASSSTKPRRSLGAIIDAIPTQRDYVPDSCSEGSGSEDEESSRLPVQSLKPIPLTPVASNRGPRVSGGLPKSGLAMKEREVQGGAERGQAPTEEYDSAMFFSVMWRKPQYKKNSEFASDTPETWDGDATIKILGNRIAMLDEDGNQMAVTVVGSKVIKPEAEFKIGGYEIQIDHRIQAEEFKSSTSILNRPRGINAASYSPATFAKPFRPPTQKAAASPMQPFKPPTSVTSHTPVAGPSATSALPTAAAAQKAVAAASFYGSTTPKPRVERIVIGEKSNKERLEWGGALYNPKTPGAIVMPRPTEKEAKLKGTSLVDVVVDPTLSNIMREHQRQGFMYECVMGMTNAEGEGCILADEMGLGKTLQTIALIYTMLKQSPFANQSGIIGKAMIVCPVSLVDNWRKEFKKWVDRRVNVLVADGADHRISSFVNNKHQHVLIIGYERLRKEIRDLASCVPPIGLIVCDEGHRLKSKDNKTTKMFDTLKTQRRIILSGTPVQNDLGEYWAMVNFACPGVLGKYAAFSKHYEKPILKSRTLNCPEKDVATGKARAEELAKLSREFVLRRTAAVLENYLPPKYEYVVFIAPSKLQLSVLSRLLDPKIVGKFIRGHGAQSLALIDIMRKISNSPMLLRKKDEETGDNGRTDSDLSTAKSAALSAIPASTHINDVNNSGKMLVLDKLLHSIHTTTEEKIVVVSNWTSTLDLIQGLCKAKRYPFLRLDGSTPAKQRQELVDRFNKDKARKDSFVFLLSAKAGGVGLNLIGASRLVLFDSDWNPSTDLQAMARIHRDGQKRPVYIYRFLTTNAIDEKIYQRQITKTGLSEQMLDHNSSEATTTNKDSFSTEELRDIFTLNLRTNGCQTHDLLGCDCTLVAREQTLQIESKPAKVDSDDGEHDYNELLESESGEDEDEKPKFVSANDYDPEPTPKMRRKAAKEQSNKLAALKHWTHYDANESKSFRGVQDTLLFNMLLDSWEKDDAVVRDSETEDEEDQDVDEEVDELESDEEGTTKKRKSMGGNKGSVAKKAKTYDVGAAVTSRKKHNLKTVAERGTGRVTFVFEKVSKSKL
ncbi:hypothetical protein B9479_001659 [Cryptococcus floricola]|uniref:DNA repair and recombination protein RAD54B n=1 Tax=Cryptococcus floricola TaxID=2591691 RepID=A0A5D3B1E8_9TREE|nr:hypothetical protein B9479_001659 [Cryptococcus floricola]